MCTENPNEMNTVQLYFSRTRAVEFAKENVAQDAFFL